MNPVGRRSDATLNVPRSEHVAPSQVSIARTIAPVLAATGTSALGRFAST